MTPSNLINVGLMKGQKQIEQWANKTTYKQFHDAIAARVIGQEDLSLITTAIWAHLKTKHSGEFYSAPSIILSAPSGCGKTETFRALRDYFTKEIPNFPVTQVDLNSITEEGFKGKDSISIVEPLMSTEESFGGLGIVFLDEFDKRIKPSHSSTSENVNANIQGQILTLIEGTLMTHTKTRMHPIDTRFTIFIACGSFDEVRKERDQKRNKIAHKTVGFGESQPEAEYVPDYSDPITKSDIVEYGALHELVGRFSIMASYHPIDGKYLTPVIDRCVKDVCDMYSLKSLTLGKEYKAHLKDLSTSKEGVRAFTSDIIQEILPTMGKIFSLEDDVLAEVHLYITKPGTVKYKSFPIAPELIDPVEEKTENEYFDEDERLEKYIADHIDTSTDGSWW